MKVFRKKLVVWSFSVLGLMAFTSTMPFAAENDETVGDPYTLSTCLVSGQELGSMGDPVIVNHEGREIRLCCQGCVGKFEEDSAAYIEKIDQAMIKDQLPHYPLGTCIISGGKLGSMGDPVNKIINNRLVQFCCGGCVGKFEANKEENFAKLDQAVIAKQSENYPLETCAVTGGKLGSMGDPVNVVIGNRLVKLCCAGCKGKLQANPSMYLSKLDGNTMQSMQGQHGNHSGHQH